MFDPASDAHSWLAEFRQVLSDYVPHLTADMASIYPEYDPLPPSLLIIVFQLGHFFFSFRDTAP